jgi:protoporphyrinogen oxidase
MNNIKSLSIIGAGASGLAVAWANINSNIKFKITIYEKSSRVGGLCGFISWKGHKIDIGPHRLSPNIESIRKIAEFILGNELLIKKSDHSVYLNGSLYKFPPKINEWINFKGLIFIAINIFSIIKTWLYYGFINKQNNQTFSSIMKLTFGSYFFNKIIQPMTEKVWCKDYLISPKFAKIRFSHIMPKTIIKDFFENKSTSNPNYFLYPKLGFHTLFDEMATQIENSGQEILRDSEILKIIVSNNKITEIEYAYEDNNHTNKNIDYVVSTIPINLLVKLIHWDDVFLLNKIRILSDKIKYRSMILVVTEFDYKELPSRVVIVPDKDIIFNRVFDQGLFSNEMVEKDKSVYVSDILCDFKADIYKENDDIIITKVLDGFNKIGIANNQFLLDYKIIRIPFAYVVPDVDSTESYSEIRHILKNIVNLELTGRFSSGEYDNSDFAIENAIYLNEMLIGNISKLNYIISNNNIYKNNNSLNSIVG